MVSLLLGRKSPGLGRASESCCRDGKQPEGWGEVWRPVLGAELHQGSRARPASARVTGRDALEKDKEKRGLPTCRQLMRDRADGGQQKSRWVKTARPLPRPLRVTSTVGMEKEDMPLCWGHT